MRREPPRRWAILAILSLLAFAPTFALDDPLDDPPDDPAANRNDDDREFQVTRLLGWGIRLGAATPPDQALIGLHFDMGEISDRFYTEPVFELSVGDDHVMFTATAQGQFRLNPHKKIRPYFGAGITAGVDYKDLPGQSSDFNFTIAWRAIGGANWSLKNRRQFFIEGARIFGSLHTYQVVVGWRF